jgi:HK97 family phage prohead protease
MALASDDSLDRYDTRIAQDWLDNGRIENFDRNPVVPWAHDYSALPVGRIVSREIKALGEGRSGLVVGVEFDEEDEMGKRVAGQYRRGVLSAFSVGFRPGRTLALASLAEGHPWRAERGYLMADNELMEISAVPVPGNPRAVAEREARWLEDAVIEAAPGSLRAEVARILAQDEEVRKLIREIGGDLHDKGLPAALPEAKHELSWLFPCTK